LAIILRVIAISQSLWLDEAIGAIAAKDYSYFTIISEFIKADNHPPFYYLVLKFWTSIFGYSEFSLRTPSLLFGTGTVFLTYLIVKSLIWRSQKGVLSSVPNISALLIALSQFHIYYSQEARMYSMAGFFVSLAFYSYILLLKNEKTKIIYWATFSFAILCLVFTDYAPIFLLPVFWIITLVKRKSGRFWKVFLLAHIPLLLFGILWLPTFFIQVDRGGWLLKTWPAWREVAGGATLKQAALVFVKFVFGRISLYNKMLYYLLVIFVSIPVSLALINSWKKREESVIWIWMWLIIPLVIGFLLSFSFPAFIYFRFVFVLPAFSILIAWGACSYKNVRLRLLIVSTIVISNIVSWVLYITDPVQQREQWNIATRFVEENAKPNEIVLFEFPEPFAPYRWYSKGSVEAKGATNSISADPDLSKEITFNLVKNKTGVFYFNYLRELSDREDTVRKTLIDTGFVKKDVYNFQGVGLVEYYTKEQQL